ncbi:hypothetical protein [Nonomuraea typhae]|uniref:Uncharacterized protein n=1 Tax=Nonomuraea typhae TaxID=2603600 RepID=A0ABW7YJC2_9ACTN
MAEFKDINGRVLEYGDLIRQLIADPACGALVQHVGAQGQVVGFGRSRVEVEFAGGARRRIKGRCLHFSHKPKTPLAPPPGPLDALADFLDGLDADSFVSLSQKGGYLNLYAQDVRQIVEWAKKGRTDG